MPQELPINDGVSCVYCDDANTTMGADHEPGCPHYEPPEDTTSRSRAKKAADAASDLTTFLGWLIRRR